MSDIDIAKLRELERAATPGPWTYCDVASEIWDESGQIVAEDGEGYGICISKCDAELLVAARNALPGLLDEIARLQMYARVDNAYLTLRAKHTGLKREVARLQVLLRDAQQREAGTAKDLLAALEENAALRRERDAAVADIEHVCLTCVSQGIPDERCARCAGSTDNWHADEDNWQWRGPAAPEAST